MLAVYNIGISNKKGENMKEVKTFTDNSWVTFDRTEVNIEGVRYTTTENFWNKVVAEDMPKMKALLGEELFEFALDGGNTIKFPEDEVWAR